MEENKEIKKETKHKEDKKCKEKDELIKTLQDKVNELNAYLRERLYKYKDVAINSNSNCIPHILNISILKRNSNDIQKYFSDNDIFLSTKTACSTNSDLSLNVFEITKDEERSKSSIRISLSYLTTKKEIDTFLNVLSNYLGEQNENN